LFLLWGIGVNTYRFRLPVPIQGGIKMSNLRVELKKWTKKNMPSKKKQPKPKKDSELNTKDFEELMGKHRPTYSRRNGAIRQR
jgi:hypothetical protein